MHHPFLVGHKVYLRGLEESDLSSDYFQWFNDQEVSRMNSHGRFPNNIKKMEQYLDYIYSNSALLVLAIIAKDSNTHIGNLSLQNIDWIDRNAELAIVSGNSPYRGKGYAKEACAIIVNHGFEQLNLHRIYCGTSEDNIPMQKLAEYVGMKVEGRRRETSFKNGRYVDYIQYGVLDREFQEIQSVLLPKVMRHDI